MVPGEILVPHKVPRRETVPGKVPGRLSGRVTAPGGSGGCPITASGRRASYKVWPCRVTTTDGPVPRSGAVKGGGERGLAGAVSGERGLGVGRGAGFPHTEKRRWPLPLMPTPLPCVAGACLSASRGLSQHAWSELGMSPNVAGPPPCLDPSLSHDTFVRTSKLSSNDTTKIHVQPPLRFSVRGRS